MSQVNYASGEYTTQDLREKLVSLGFDEEDLEGLRKAVLVQMIQENEGEPEDDSLEEDSFDEAELEDDDLPIVKTKGKGTKMQVNPAWPQRGTKEWQEFVLSHFTEDEKWTFEEVDDKGKSRKLDTVKASGLARVGELLLGTPISAGPIREELSFQGPKGLPYAYVCYRLVFQTPNGVREITELADSSYLNTEDKFLAFPLAGTTTKAMGRAWKVALGVNLYAKEEMATKDTTKVVEEIAADWNTDEEITSNQRRTIINKCSKLRLNVYRLLNSVGEKNSKGETISSSYTGNVKRYDGLDDSRLTKAHGTRLLELLGRMERKECTIDESLRGADSV